MAEVQWTKEQRAAIEARGHTLLVSAAAGSGKTAVLVERAVRLITDAAHPVAADRLLIVTFTRAAAEELRGRIAVRLAAEAAAHPESAYLRRQRLLLGRANICTIDAFCMQLLKRYFAELGLPPDFELADDAKAYTLRQNALSAVLEELYEDADFCAFASLYGRARSDASAAAAVLGLYDFSRTLPHPAAALQSICAAYESGQPLGQTAWGRTLLENAGRAARSALRLLDAAKGIVAQEPEPSFTLAAEIPQGCVEAKASIAGAVWKVLVEPGQQVEKGDEENGTPGAHLCPDCHRPLERVKEESYWGQYLGQSDFSGIDAITGASISSKAVKSGVEAAAQLAIAIMEQEVE
mgnify:CR=1 FL=1